MPSKIGAVKEMLRDAKHYVIVADRTCRYVVRLEDHDAYVEQHGGILDYDHYCLSVPCVSDGIASVGSGLCLHLCTELKARGAPIMCR